MRTRPKRWPGRALDLLLFVPALLFVVSEHVLWAGSRALLRTIAGLSAVRAAHLWLGLLPPYAALPVFLVPDLFSHASELWAGVLLARGHMVAATVLVVLGKGLATVVLVWIYQACEPALLRVAWFARLHHAVLRLRERVLDRVRPARAWLVAVLPRSATSGWHVTRRFRWLRRRVAVGLLPIRPRN